MLAEMLVIFSCANSMGCSQTSTVYFATHPHIKEMVNRHGKKAEEVAREFVGPATLHVVGPVIYMAAGGTGTVRLTKTISLQLNVQRTVIMYGLDF